MSQLQILNVYLYRFYPCPNWLCMKWVLTIIPADFSEYNVYFYTIPYKDLGQFSLRPLQKHLVFLFL